MYYSKVVDEYDSVIDERFYIYDGLDCIAETDIDGTILREYIRIGNVGGIVAEIRHNDTTCASGYQSGTFYYHYNHRGDVIAVSSHNGGIIFKADYDAYGKITRIDSGSFEPRYTFSTKRYFSELGLYYYGYRWYLPELGRWMRRDPIGLASGLNQYEFCKNNPCNYIDMRGFKALNLGPVTIPLGHKPGTPNASKRAEAAHEKQHRKDFWNGNQFTMPDWQLEQRGFKAAIPVLKDALKDSSLSPKERKEIELELNTTEILATSEMAARIYANDPHDIALTITTPQSENGNINNPINICL